MKSWQILSGENTRKEYDKHYRNIINDTADNKFKSNVKKRLKELKEEHPKAVHHCFAYRIDTDGNNFRSSDDGEPSGSAGKPILGQIDSKELTNTAIVVVRYFGGTLLGIPGLINAYKTSASFALQLNPIIKKPVLINYRLQFDYTILNDVMRIIKKNDCVILKQELQLFCMIEASIPKSQLELCILQLKNLKSMELSAIWKFIFH